MPKISTYPDIGDIATGDKLLGERVDNTTVRFTYVQPTMNGTLNRLDVTPGTDTFTFNISTSYAGQNTIVTLGTIATGTWQGTPIANAYLANTAVANLSGVNTGDQTNISGNAATVTTNANLTGPITSVGNATAVASQTGTGSTFVMNTSPTLVTPTFTAPVLGTPTSGDLSNCTGYTLANINGLGANVATFLATPSSANLLAALTDETGTGSAVFNTSPTLVTPVLGTPTSGNIKNCVNDGAFIGRTTDLTVVTSTVTVVACDYEQFDNGGLHDTVTNNSRITIVTTGIYYVQAFAYWDSNNTNLRQIYIKKNGATFPFTDVISAALVTGADTQSVSAVMFLSATDYLELAVWQNSGGDLLLKGDSLSSFISGLVVQKIG